jgi:RHS repeat-associated protein
MDQFEADKLVQFRSEWVVQLEPDLMDHCNRILQLLEETHYYAFGLKIAGISSKKMPDAHEGMVDNKYLYNDKELFDDGDLDWYDYDPQIGRWIQQDPYDQYASPYVGMGNSPVNGVDRDGGLFGLSTTELKLVGTMAGAIIGGTIGGLSSDDGRGAWTGAHGQVRCSVGQWDLVEHH